MCKFITILSNSFMSVLNFNILISNLNRTKYFRTFQLIVGWKSYFLIQIAPLYEVIKPTVSVCLLSFVGKGLGVQLSQTYASQMTPILPLEALWAQWLACGWSRAVGYDELGWCICLNNRVRKRNDRINRVWSLKLITIILTWSHKHE